MKQRHIFILLLCTTLRLAAQEAATTRPSHYIGIYGTIGYSNMLWNASSSHSIGGIGGGLGIGYQLNYSHFIFQTGIEVLSLNSLQKWDPFSLTVPIADESFLENKRADYCYRFHTMRENIVSGFGYIPILFGGQYNGWYFLAGPKIGINLWASTRSYATIETAIRTDFLLDDLTNMPNHALALSTANAHDRLHLRPDFALSMEIGKDLDPWLQYKPKRKSRKKTFREMLHYRVALVAECGVLNTKGLPTASTWITTSATPSLEPVTLVSSLTANDFADKRLLPFYVGAKFSIFYEVPQKQQHRRQPAGKGRSTSTSRPATKKKPVQKPVATPTEEQRPVVFQEQTIERGDTVVLQNLYFATDKTDILPASEETLQALYALLNENPDIKVLIVGHTDNQGTAEYNLRLSKQRAESVAKSMQEKGIDAQRMTTEGRGIDEPIANNNTKEGRAQNRRVEIIIQ